MPFRNVGAIRYFSFNSFEAVGVLHGAVTRRGGVSLPPWESLNVGGTVGDEPSHVLENRRLLFQAFDKSLASLFDVWQVHGTQVVCAEAPRQMDQPHQQADAILSSQPGVTLFMRFADCVPIFLFDPVKKVIGLLHAGWQGTVAQIARHTVEAMQRCYNVRPQDLLAGIGPSIGPHHYEVGHEVVEQVEAAFGADASQVLTSPNGFSQKSGVQFDLWSANRLVLERAGVQQVEVAALCTACHPEDWYSHRGDRGRTGRFGAIISL